MEGEWELCKENFVPVKSGRRVGTLLEVVDPGDSSKKTSLEQQKRSGIKYREPCKNMHTSRASITLVY